MKPPQTILNLFNTMAWVLVFVSTVHGQTTGVTLGVGMSNLYGARDIFDFSPAVSLKAALTFDFNLKKDFIINWDNQYARLGARSEGNASSDRLLHYIGFAARAGKLFANNRMGATIGPYLNFLTNPEVGSGKYISKLNALDIGLCATVFYQHSIQDQELRYGIETGFGFNDLQIQAGKNFYAMLVVTWFFRHTERQI